MNDSMQKILSSLYETAAKDSEAAAAKIREAFQSLATLIETPRNEITKLKDRVDALEADVADLKVKTPSA